MTSTDLLARFLTRANREEQRKWAAANPAFARLESDFAAVMAQPLPADIPRPADPVAWLDDEEK